MHSENYKNLFNDAFRSRPRKPVEGQNGAVETSKYVVLAPHVVVVSGLVKSYAQKQMAPTAKGGVGSTTKTAL